MTGAAKRLNFFAPLLERPYPALLFVVLVVSLLSGMASAWWFATLGGSGAGVPLREIVCWLRRASGTRPDSASSAATKPMTELRSAVEPSGRGKAGAAERSIATQRVNIDA